MTRNRGRIRLIVTALLALLVTLAACGPQAETDKITALVVNPSEATLKIDSEEKGTAQLSAELQYESGKTEEVDVDWESSDPEIATVSAAGLVTAVSAGEATVTATTTELVTERSATTAITVEPADAQEPAAKSLTVSPGELELGIGGKKRLTATVNFDDGSSQPAENMTWTSDDEDVATVSNDGLVTAVATGDATLTGASGDYPDLDAVTVSVMVLAVPAPEATSLTVIPGTLELQMGGTESGQLIATLHFDDGSSEPAENMTWSSDQPSIATVSDYGLVTAVATGTATITGTSGDHPDLDGVTITVGVDPAVLDTAKGLRRLSP